MHYMLISYVPLLVGEPGRTDVDNEEIAAALEEADNVVHGVVWLQEQENGKVAACLLVENAKAVASHLVAWAEGKPQEWFSVVVAEHGDLYGLALMPDLQKGVERFRIAYQLRHGYPIPANAEFEAVFKPLNFVSKPGHIFSEIRKRLPDRILVSMMERDDFVGPDTDFGKKIELGRFKIAQDGPLVQYVVSNLEKAGG